MKSTVPYILMLTNILQNSPVYFSVFVPSSYTLICIVRFNIFEIKFNDGVRSGERALPEMALPLCDVT